MNVWPTYRGAVKQAHCTACGGWGCVESRGWASRHWVPCERCHADLVAEREARRQEQAKRWAAERARERSEWETAS